MVTSGLGESRLRVSTARRRNLPVERGISIKHLEILHHRLLETRVLRRRIAFGRAEKNLAEAEINFASKVWDHATHVMSNDFEVRQLVKYFLGNERRDSGPGLVGPS